MTGRTRGHRPRPARWRDPDAAALLATPPRLFPALAALTGPARDHSYDCPACSWGRDSITLCATGAGLNHKETA